MTTYKVVHVPFTYFPEAVGGTEIYVTGLAQELSKIGITNVIAAPAADEQCYAHNGLAVRRFRTAPDSPQMLREIYGAGDAVAAASFARILDEEKPDVVHLHSFTRANSNLLVRAAKQRGLGVVLTYHTPTVSCQRGTLLRWGRELCDGYLETAKCTSCALQAQGLPRLGSRLLGRLPPALGEWCGRRGLAGGMWTALRMTELVSLRQEAFRKLVSTVDKVVALCSWSKDLLLRNGVPASKITLSRHGLAEYPAESELPPLLSPALRPLCVAFLGRADPVKGADTLIRALRAAPDLPVQLDLYGISQHDIYWNSVQQLAAGDGRITFKPTLTYAQVISTLRGYHLLAVPSRWLETGPLVMLEAFAAGVPVIGSNLGGIAELVQDNVNGLLLPADNIAAWSGALRRCHEDRTLLARLRAGIQAPRRMRDVAQDMMTLYHQVAGGNLL